ncbi:hypothetical protein NKH73_13950 [Mesorhizobium sp. M0938]|uniref:hypothetical protein n=1 Tax=unclassified Mesorhizobium TaxID=325217 RepID=UPI00333DA897
MKLTEAQRRFLRRAELFSLRDGSGSGALPVDGIEILVAERLAAKGLVTVPVAWTAFTGAKVTAAGRAALQQEPRP